jgi:hypothetical protein
MARPAVENVDVFFRDLAIISGMNIKRSRTWPDWPFEEDKSKVRSTDWKGSKSARGICAAPKVSAVPS